MIEKSRAGVIGGREVSLYKLTNSLGAYITVLDYGCTITSVVVPDKNGRLTDVALGYETLDEYVKNDGYLGMLVGRCANRIAKGRFTLDGREYSLAVNNGPNHLHGGINGFSGKVFDCSALGNTLRFSAFSPDGEENYPGSLTLIAEYSFTDDCELILNYKAVTDKRTIVNITNHSYFDLNGQGSGRAMEQSVRIFADALTEIDDTSIPTGVLRPLKKGDPFDFSEPKELGRDINAEDIQLKMGTGYDHNFVLSDNFTGEYGIYGLKYAAQVTGRETGIVMDIFTTMPGMQMYTANFLDNRNGKNGKTYDLRCGAAFETQNFPDAVNHPDFPSPVLEPLQIYDNTTIYRFKTTEE